MSATSEVLEQAEKMSLKEIKEKFLEGLNQPPEFFEQVREGVRYIVRLENLVSVLKSELQKERECVDFYAKDTSWYGLEGCNNRIHSWDWNKENMGGEKARDRQKQRIEI